MTRTQYLTRTSLNLASEAAVWLAFGALGWTCVSDAETFVALVERKHFTLALLIIAGIIAYVFATCVAIPLLHDKRALIRSRRNLTIIRAEQLAQCSRLVLLEQTPIDSDEDARKVLRFARTMKGPGR